MALPTQEDIQQLFDSYDEDGCPCRYPRLRAAVGRDLADIGAPEWAVSDTRLLLEEFDRRFRGMEQESHSFGFNARCGACGARVQRFGVPVFRDSFIERAIIEPAGASDLGAAVGGGVAPIVGHVYAAAPGNWPPVQRERIQRAFPRFDVPTWLSYMGEQAEVATQTRPGADPIHQPHECS